MAFSAGSRSSIRFQNTDKNLQTSTGVRDGQHSQTPADTPWETEPIIPFYQLRNRDVMKLLTPIPNFLVTKPQIKVEESEPTPTDCSQESVSMLQDIYEPASEGFPELMETCMNSKLDIITISSDEESEPEECDAPITRKPTSKREEQVEKHASFIAGIVKLREMVSAKEDVPAEKVSSILKRAGVSPMEGVLEDEETCTVPNETVEYLLKSAETENVVHETVQALLTCLEEDIEKDIVKISCCWKESVYEMAVEVLSKVVDYELQVRQTVGTFLCKMAGSILRNERDKNLVLESKSMLITTFCRSIHLSYTVINFIINNLKSLKTIKNKTELATLEDKLAWTRLTKNSYYLLKILETLLKSFKTKLEGEDIEVLSENPGMKNYNVLEMWKKNWRQVKVPEEKKPQHEYKSVVGKWCQELDDVLVHCVKHAPVSSLIVGRCGSLAKDIMKMCHPEVIKAASD